MVKKLFFLIMLMILIFGVVNLFYIQSNSQLSLSEVPKVLHKTIEVKKPAKPINVLIIGIDQRGNEISRSDTIMVYNLDPKNKIGLLSVPRDTYVNIPGRGIDKINHAYAYGGIDLCRRTLEQFLGIKIDYYIETNFIGFQELVNQIGGITVNVDKDISGTDIKRGQQKLNGERALAYVRDRQDPMGDIARVERQQKFMKALALEITYNEPKWKLIYEIPMVYKSVKTDLNIEGAQALYEMIQNNDFENIQMEQVPGWFYNYKGISYWRPDTNKTNLIVQKIFFNVNPQN